MQHRLTHRNSYTPGQEPAPARKKVGFIPSILRARASTVQEAPRYHAGKESDPTTQAVPSSIPVIFTDLPQATSVEQIEALLPVPAGDGNLAKAS